MEDYDNSEYRAKARAKSLSQGNGIINVDDLKKILAESTQGPWHWVEHDYSMASLQGPAEEWDHVMSVSPCQACQNRAKEKEENPEWKWGRCTCPTEANAKLLALAPALAEAYLQSIKYPIQLAENIIQYSEHVFVWFDEIGAVGGAANTLQQVKNELKLYAKQI